MFNVKIILITSAILIITLYNFTFSQDKLKIGFDLHYETFYYSRESNSSEFPTIDLIARYNFMKHYYGQFYVGYTLPIIDSWNYVGPDFGIAVNRNLLNNWLYARLDFMLHYNTRNGHVGTGAGYETFKKFIPLLGFGFDIYTSENICINLLFIKSLDEKLYYSFSYDSGNYVTTIGEMKYFLKVGFSFYWNIF